MRRPVLLPSLIVLLLAGRVAAAEDDPLAAIRARAAQVAALRVPFSQEKRLAILDQPLVSQGMLELDRRAHAVRLSFTGSSVLALKAGRLRRWGPDGREESTGDDPALAAVVARMQALLDGDLAAVGDIFRTASVAPAEGQPGCTAVRLLPKTADLARQIERLDLVLRDADAAPVRLLLVAAGGDETDYRFAAPELLGAIAAGRFDAP